MKNWIKDIVTILLAAVIWWFTPYLTRALDPTAGVDDAGMLQRITFAVVALLIFHSVAKMFMRLFWPILDIYLRIMFTSNFLKGYEWQKQYLSAFFYLAIILVLAILF
jgi:hypothetical protein